MKICTLMGIAVVLICTNMWQVNAGDNAPSPTDYLKASGKKKLQLRDALLKLSANELQEAIANAGPVDPVAPGVLERETDCPDGFRRPFWLYVPENYDAKKNYPMVVCLHGSCAQMPMRGRNGGEAPAQRALNYWKDNLPDVWKSEVVLLGCAAGVPETNANAVWYFKNGEENVLHMIAEAKRIVGVDDNRVFVSGHSDGGNGSFGFAFRRPDAFAGYLPMNGNFTVPMMDETPIWWENLIGQKIYAFNGKADELYPANELTPFYDLANSLGADIKYKVYDDLTHDIAPVVANEVRVSLDERIAKWKRDLKPTELDWTCTDPARGHRAWISIDAIRDLGDFNEAPENSPLAGDRPRLGLQLADAEAPTVGSISAGGAAKSAGLKVGDVFLKFDEAKIASVQDLVTALGKKRSGDSFKVTVKRDGKEVELEGEFPSAKADAEWRSPGKARVIASWKRGSVRVTVSNASKVSIYVFAEMLDEAGALSVTLNGKKQDLGKIEPDRGFILDEFERTADRSLPWLRRVEINVAELMKD